MASRRPRKQDDLRLTLKEEQPTDWSEPAPSTVPLLPAGARLCVDCLSVYPAEAQLRCASCGGAVCPTCSIALEELDAALCLRCLGTSPAAA